MRRPTAHYSTAPFVAESRGTIREMTPTFPWKTAIIVGASSGIGSEIARQLAGGGVAVALVARRADELNELANEIGPLARVYVHDVTDYDAVPGLFQQICRDGNGLDLIVYAAGVMATFGETEYSFADDRRTVEVNVLGAMAWLNEAAHRFQVARTGTIVGIGSVAGDRGRRKFPSYSASKAALETYLEGLRNRVGRYGVSVVTIKPGPVKTPMTAHLEKQPLVIDAPTAARQILAASGRRARVAYVPGKWRPIMAVVRAVPSRVFQKTNF